VQCPMLHIPIPFQDSFGSNVPPLASGFSLCANFDLEYAALACSIKFCLCSYSFLVAATFADVVMVAW
jgi:hypothetical protein